MRITCCARSFFNVCVRVNRFCNPILEKNVFKNQMLTFKTERIIVQTSPCVNAWILNHTFLLLFAKKYEMDAAFHSGSRRRRLQFHTFWPFLEKKYEMDAAFSSELLLRRPRFHTFLPFLEKKYEMDAPFSHESRQRRPRFHTFWPFLEKKYEMDAAFSSESLHRRLRFHTFLPFFKKKYEKGTGFTSGSRRRRLQFHTFWPFFKKKYEMEAEMYSRARTPNKKNHTFSENTEKSMIYKQKTQITVLQSPRLKIVALFAGMPKRERLPGKRSIGRDPAEKSRLINIGKYEAD